MINRLKKRADGIMTYHLHAHYAGRWQAWLSMYNPQTRCDALRALLQHIRPDVALNNATCIAICHHAAFSVAHGLRIPAVFTSHDVPFHIPNTIDS
jgi:hypothetical protein